MTEINKTFDFDSEQNVVHIRTPSVTPISKNFCGLWISNDDLIACGWNGGSTKEHTILTRDNKEIKGYGILNPRICVIRRTKLLRLDNAGKLLGLWMKGDGEYRDEKGIKLYYCVRRYLLIFLDENNEPLHEKPLQLTAKGNFQVDFDRNLIFFRTNIERAYAFAKRKSVGCMSDEWHAMCVFCPVFESRIVGSGNRTAEACMVKTYVIPTEKDWFKLCVGYNEQTTEFVNNLYYNSHKWMTSNS